MKSPSFMFVLMLALAASAFGQAPSLATSHAPQVKPSVSHAAGAGKVAAMAAKPVARVNGSTLNEVDLVREMYAIFPYARQHNGFPKDLEPEIRRGALDMLVFEELLYQEAKRLNKIGR